MMSRWVDADGKPLHGGRFVNAHLQWNRAFKRLTEEVCMQQEEIDRKDKLIDDLRSELKEAREIVCSRNTEIEELKNKLTESFKRENDQLRQISELHRKIVEVNHELMSLKMEIHKLKSSTFSRLLTVIENLN